MVPVEVERWLAAITGPLGIVKKRVETGVRQYCDECGYAYSGRLKDSKSIADKLETGRIPSLKTLDDAFGCSIIIPNLSHEPGAIRRLDEMFARVVLKARG